MLQNHDEPRISAAIDREIEQRPQRLDPNAYGAFAEGGRVPRDLRPNVHPDEDHDGLS